TMKRILFILVIAASQVKAKGIYLRWENDYDGVLHFQCPAGQSISKISSTHHNHHEDRLWGFECKNTFDSSPDCHWTYYVNDFDQEFSFECPSNYVLSGMESYHENKHEDRRWKFYCCRINNFCNSNCQWTPYVNNFDETFDFYIPTQNYLVGTGSYHNNHHE
uniref:Si:dkey-14d8.6 n=1 Tax=Scleropages formosus TaxID=113540 RepID=A0A8C9T4L3_SCLFO